MKRCSKCGLRKQLDRFPRRKSSADGRRNECRDCAEKFHAGWRNANTERVREVARESAKRRRAANPQKMREYANQYRAKNAGKARAAYRTWYEANKDASSAATAAWGARNPGWYQRYVERNREAIREKRRQWARTNRAAETAKARRYHLSKRRASPLWLSPIQVALIAEHYEIAAARSVQTGIPHDVDHIVPLNGKSVCGLHVPWNLQVIPAVENRAKRNLLLETLHG